MVTQSPEKPQGCKSGGSYRPEKASEHVALAAGLALNKMAMVTLYSFPASCSFLLSYIIILLSRNAVLCMLSEPGLEKF